MDELSVKILERARLHIAGGPGSGDHGHAGRPGEIGGSGGGGHETSLSKIGEAGKENKVITFSYRKKDGGVKEYKVQPYEFKNGVFWGFDIEEKKIKQFRIEGIKKVHKTDEKFTPQWPVKFD